jgi:methylmalonyl-CoA mutase C-terminal domain/subunit
VLLFGGGIIPEDDLPGLRTHGVERIFPPGASLEEIVAYVREAVGRKRGVTTHGT